MVISNLPADLADLTRDLQSEDEILSDDELGVISVFANLRRTPSFSKFPGSTILRSCTPGRVLCSQAEAGATAFYILNDDDIESLQAMKAILAKFSPIETELTKIESELGSEGLGDDRRSQLEDCKVELLAQKKLFDVEKKQLEDDVVQRVHTAADLAEKSPDQLPKPRQKAVALLSVDRDSHKGRKGLLHRFAARFRRQKDGDTTAMPDYIPMDGPTDLDAKTLTAPLNEGEIFGEMSCISRTPRSATVYATENCLVIEMLINIFDMARRDEVFKKRLDAIYRQRTLKSHIRSLSIFEELNDDEFNQLKNKVSLEVFVAGDVLFDEHHEPSDCFYVVRSGLIKIVKNMHLLFGPKDMSNDRWKDVAGELLAAIEMPDSTNVELLNALPDELKSICGKVANGGADDTDIQAFRTGLNEFIRDVEFVDKLSKATKQKKGFGLLPLIGMDGYQSKFETFDESIANWSQIERRIFQRLFLESVCTSLPQRNHSLGSMRTLSYLGRGTHLGEMGVLQDVPRSTTCIAYEHPGSVVESRVEVVKIDADTLHNLMKSSPALVKQINQVVAERDSRTTEAESKSVFDVTSGSQTMDFDRLGLIQGQQLMLIDLDRCTRCGECVNACVDAHDDGHTRLYLDGPRIEKYLVPLTCRKCLDPVCMIGCPVGAINRGDNGEIRITDWCIGCSLCADQCPYGSIHMNAKESNDLQPTQQVGEIKIVTQQATVCDLCSSTHAQEPSCVYACPHDAAIRVDSQEFFFN